MRFYSSDKAPEAIGPYSQAVRSGNLLFCSGQTPIVPGTKSLNGVSIESQTEQTFANIRAVLASANLELKDVVKATVFLKDFDNFSKMNEIYARAFGDHRPVRTTVEVSRLPLDCLIEIEVVATFE